MINLINEDNEKKNYNKNNIFYNRMINLKNTKI